MNDDLKRKYELLWELAQDCERRYKQYGSDSRLNQFLWDAWLNTLRAYDLVARDYVEAMIAEAQNEVTA